MAACISTSSSLGHATLQEVFRFSSYQINDPLVNNIHSNNKRLKFGHDDDADDQYSFKKVDEIFKLQINDPLANNIHSNNNKRLKFGHDGQYSFSTNNNKLPCLKMVAGSLYVPKDNPNKPLGEDAHFIHELYQTIGVADGVGGWDKKGIDTGIYARELMKNSVIATNNESKGHVNPKRVLQEAYKTTNYEGSSTACIITVKKNTICAANVGDSGFFLIRKGKIMYKYSIQQRGFGCPYQLGKCKDNPSIAQEMELDVEKNDILIVGTDEMLYNMNESEIEEIVRRGIDEKLKAEEFARKIGNIALYNSFDRFADTPYARASDQRHKGGKIDDITVIVAYIH